jgi:hypothetical protein
VKVSISFLPLTNPIELPHKMKKSFPNHAVAPKLSTLTAQIAGTVSGTNVSNN